MKKQKPKNKKNGKIVQANCYVKLTDKACFIDLKDQSFITNRELLERLISGKLETSTHKKARSIRLGLITDDGIDNDIQVFLTKKDKSMYFVPEENEVYIAPLSDFEKLISREYRFVQMGKFEDQ